MTNPSVYQNAVTVDVFDRDGAELDGVTGRYTDNTLILSFDTPLTELTVYQVQFTEKKDNGEDKEASQKVALEVWPVTTTPASGNAANVTVNTKNKAEIAISNATDYADGTVDVRVYKDVDYNNADGVTGEYADGKLALTFPDGETGAKTYYVAFIYTPAGGTTEDAWAESGTLPVSIRFSGSSSSSSSSSSSGAPSTTPSTDSTTVNPPTTSESSDTTTVEVSTSSTTTGATAKAEVSSADMDKAVESAIAEAAKQETAPVVAVNVQTAANATALEATLPASSLKTLAEADNASLVISSNVAEVTLDNAALDALVGQAAGSTITLEVAPVAESELNAAQRETLADADVTVVDLSIASNGVVIEDYKGGKITISLPYTLPEGQSADDVTAYYLADNGRADPCDTSYTNGTVTFTTTA